MDGKYVHSKNALIQIAQPLSMGVLELINGTIELVDHDGVPFRKEPGFCTMRNEKRNNRIIFGSKCVYPGEDFSSDRCKSLCRNSYLCAAVQHRVYANKTVAGCDVLFDSKDTFVCSEGGKFMNASSKYVPGYENPYGGLLQTAGRAGRYSNSSACYIPVKP